MIRRGFLAVALAAAVPSLALVPALAQTAKPEPGKPAPAFEAVDSNGKALKLADFKGKTVVLEWTNHDCPYVRKHYGAGNMQALQADAAAKGVVWLSVISSAKGAQGYADGLEANKLTDDRKAKPTAVVLDPSGSLGRLYGATATPHMFVINKDGALVYGGAIDDKPSSNPADIPKARNFVREAITAAADGKTMSPAMTRAYGCSVKYSGS
jgi:peroxiredoxin